MKELTIKKCFGCGATVEVIKDCTCQNCGLQCCGKPMVELKANTSDGVAEKHLPTYEVVGAYIVVRVPHVMEQEHYIEYVALVSDKINAKKYFVPGDEPKAVFPYIPGSTIYSVCNKHGVWQAEVK